MPSRNEFLHGSPRDWLRRAHSSYEPVTEDDYRKAIEQAQVVLEWAAEIIESGEG